MVKDVLQIENSVYLRYKEQLDCTFISIAGFTYKISHRDHEVVEDTLTKERLNKAAAGAAASPTNGNGLRHRHYCDHCVIKERSNL